LPEPPEPGTAPGQGLLGSDLQFPPVIPGIPDQGYRPLGLNQPVAEPITYVAPGLYGQGWQKFVTGEGRLAGPSSTYRLSISTGYDSDPSQSSNANSNSGKSSGSGFSGAAAHAEFHRARPSSLLTLSLNGGATFYWDRNQEPDHYNAGLALLYLQQIDPRTQVTANLTFAFLPQADYTNIYASQSPNGLNSSYITTSSKLDLQHAWGAHFSTNTSAAANLLYYTEGGQANSSENYLNITLGNEFRFSWSRRVTWVVDGRYEILNYIDDSALNSDTIYFLGGVDWDVSRRMTTTLRAGGSVRNFESGGSTTSPYVEVAANYKTSRRASLALTGRYGFDQGSNGGSTGITTHVGMAYRQGLTSRLSGQVGFYYTNTDHSDSPAFSGASNSYDFNVGLSYRVNRHLGLSAQYGYTQYESGNGAQNYDRNRATVSAGYQF
jgi:hypothetical protein